MHENNETNKTTLIHTKTISENRTAFTWPKMNQPRPQYLFRPSSSCSSRCVHTEEAAHHRAVYLTDDTETPSCYLTAITVCCCMDDDALLALRTYNHLYMKWRERWRCCSFICTDPLVKWTFWVSIHSAQNVPSKLIPTSRTDARLLCKAIKGCQATVVLHMIDKPPPPTPPPLLEKGDLFFRDLPEENILIGLSYENWQREKDL